MQFGRYFEEFEIGDLYRHWPGKTVTEYDDHLFCLLTMNHHPLHLDAHFANETTDFKQNVVVGNYIYSLLLGMSVEDVSGKAIANLEIESLRHVRPTFHGDTIYGETEVLAKVESRSKSDRGVVSVETRGYTQDGEVVCISGERFWCPNRVTAKPAAATSPAAQRREISERPSDEGVDFGGSRRQGCAMKKRYEAFLDGGEHLTHGGEYFETSDPATGEILAEVSKVKSEDVDDAVASARAAFPASRDTVPSDRGRILRRWPVGSASKRTLSPGWRRWTPAKHFAPRGPMSKRLHVISSTTAGPPTDCTVKPSRSAQTMCPTRATSRSESSGDHPLERAHQPGRSGRSLPHSQSATRS